MSDDNCNVVKLALREADLLAEEHIDQIMRRLKGKTLNLFEAVLTDKKQLAAIKKLLQDVLNDVIVTDVRQRTREILLSIARKFDCGDVKFRALPERSEVK